MRRSLLPSLALLGLLAAADYGEALSPRSKPFLNDPRVPPAERVAKARETAAPILKKRFQELGLSSPPTSVFLRAFKDERVLEVWVAASSGPYQLFKAYPIAAASGILGPKRKEGDKQVPEGCYRITEFNPASKFHLSMRVDYPNASDRIRSDAKKPGGDIFIHGDQRSIGCLAMTDAVIEVLYTLCRSVSAPIPVHIFPTRLTPARLSQLSEEHPKHAAFWKELSPIYQAFERTKRVPGVSVEADGGYILRRT